MLRPALGILIALLLPFSAQASLHKFSGGAAPPVIQSIVLSGASVQFAASAPYYVGTLTTNLSPQTPTFNNHPGSSYTLVSSGGSCSGGDTAHFQIIGDGVYTNALAAGTYTLCVTASAAGIAPVTQLFTNITEGNKIDAAASFCAVHGGGDGSSGTPWQAACIQAAANSAVDGDTVFLAAGNWALNITASPVVSSTSINLVGAGSGNTFSPAGNINNASGADFCPTSSTVTCVYATPPSSSQVSECGGTGGYIQLTGNIVAVSHIFFDGSPATDGGDACALLSFRNVPGSATATDIRTLAYFHTTVANAETQIAAFSSNNVTWQNSHFADPFDMSLGYTNSQVLSTVTDNVETLKNSVIWQGAYNPIYDESLLVTGVFVFNTTDPSNGFGPSYDPPSWGWAGCFMGQFCEFGQNQGPSPPHQGSFHFTATNNYFNATGFLFEWGGGVNDSGTTGGISDLHFVGNWTVGSNAAIDSCVWFIRYGPPCAGMTINANVDDNCIEGAGSSPWDVTNNSIIGSASAQLNARGSGTTGCFMLNPPAVTSASWAANQITFVTGASRNLQIVPGEMFVTANFTSSGYNGTWTAASGTSCSSGGCTLIASDMTNPGTATGPGVVQQSTIQLMTYGYNATQNYLSGPSNQYNSNSNTISPVVTGNYCSGSTFTQTDSSTCATSGFTTLPTASFSLGPLFASGTDLCVTSGGSHCVPFTATNFTAQYGAVEWLVSTSPTPPGSGDSRWSFVPPAYLSGVTHGNTVYMWTMDSANNISTAASALIP